MTAWNIVHVPGAATQATASQAAAGAGRRNVMTGLNAGLISATATTANTVVIRNGASGVGPILWQSRINLLLTEFGQAIITRDGMFLIGSANTAMTIEISAAPPAGVFGFVAASGYVI